MHVFLRQGQYAIRSQLRKLKAIFSTMYVLADNVQPPIEAVQCYVRYILIL